MMRKVKMWVNLRYCNYCKKRLKDYSCTVSENGKKHWHSQYTGKETCYEKYQKAATHHQPRPAEKGEKEC
jgi:hypothetical protein